LIIVNDILWEVKALLALKGKRDVVTHILGGNNAAHSFWTTYFINQLYVDWEDFFKALEEQFSNTDCKSHNHYLRFFFVHPHSNKVSLFKFSRFLKLFRPFSTSVNQLVELKELGCFYPFLEKEKAVKMISTATAGSFLIRTSGSIEGFFVLEYCYVSENSLEKKVAKQLVHPKTVRNEDGVYYMYCLNKKSNKIANSITTLLYQYRHMLKHPIQYNITSQLVTFMAEDSDNPNKRFVKTFESDNFDESARMLEIWNFLSSRTVDRNKYKMYLDTNNATQKGLYYKDLVDDFLAESEELDYGFSDSNGVPVGCTDSASSLLEGAPDNFKRAALRKADSAPFLSQELTNSALRKTGSSPLLPQVSSPNSKKSAVRNPGSSPLLPQAPSSDTLKKRNAESPPFLGKELSEKLKNKLKGVKSDESLGPQSSNKREKTKSLRDQQQEIITLSRDYSNLVSLESVELELVQCPEDPSANKSYQLYLKKKREKRRQGGSGLLEIYSDEDLHSSEEKNTPENIRNHTPTNSTDFNKDPNKEKSTHNNNTETNDNNYDNNNDTKVDNKNSNKHETEDESFSSDKKGKDSRKFHEINSEDLPENLKAVLSTYSGEIEISGSVIDLVRQSSTGKARESVPNTNPNPSHNTNDKHNPLNDDDHTKHLQNTTIAPELNNNKNTNPKKSTKNNSSNFDRAEASKSNESKNTNNNMKKSSKNNNNSNLSNKTETPNSNELKNTNNNLKKSAKNNNSNVNKPETTRKRTKTKTSGEVPEDASKQPTEKVASAVLKKKKAKLKNKQKNRKSKSKKKKNPRKRKKTLVDENLVLMLQSYAVQEEKEEDSGDSHESNTPSSTTSTTTTSNEKNIPDKLFSLLESEEDTAVETTKENITENSIKEKMEPDNQTEDNSATDDQTKEESLSWSCEGMHTLLFSELQINEQIGSGNFGQVYKGAWRGVAVAVKIVDNFSLPEAEKLSIRQETLMIAKLGNHPNVVRFIGACVNDGALHLVTQYHPKGSVYDILIKRKENIKWKKLVKIACDAACGIFHLHCENIVHRDIAARNILIDENWNGVVADFGLSRLLHSRTYGTTNTCLGPFQYMAPECLDPKKQHFSFKSDSYSFGVFLWEMLTRDIPFRSQPPIAVILEVLQNDARPPIPQNADPAFVYLIQKCWAKKSKERPDFSVILKYLKEYLSTL